METRSFSWEYLGKGSFSWGTLERFGEKDLVFIK
jgi:hypothetical protein